MKHVFILNPAAGKNKRALSIIPEIKGYFEKNPADYVIDITKASNDATKIARFYAQSQKNVRFYSCGGDGTLLEVLNGAYGHENCEIACIPCGSANDYIKNFDNQELFQSVDAQVNGMPHKVDTIDCNGRMSLNICCMGMDADVADKMKYFKNYPLVSGHNAYRLAVAYMFFKRIGRQLIVRIESQSTHIEHKGDYLFALAASGKCYGGGYYGAPQACPDDGVLDFVFVDTIKRLQVLGFLKKYKAGNHLDMPIVHSFRGSSMRVTSTTPVTVCIDGETFSEREITFKVCPHSVSFILPQKNIVNNL